MLIIYSKLRNSEITGVNIVRCGSELEFVSQVINKFRNEKVTVSSISNMINLKLNSEIKFNFVVRVNSKKETSSNQRAKIQCIRQFKKKSSGKRRKAVSTKKTD